MYTYCERCGNRLPEGTVCSCTGNTYNPVATTMNQQQVTGTNYQQPPVQNYQQPPVQNYQQPPAQNYQQPPVQNYQQPPVQNYQQPPVQNYWAKQPAAPKVSKEAATSFWESMKNRMGIGDPDLNKGDAYEKGKQIIPDCVKANEGEVPVKQYKVALLRNRILGIPYSKAVGRMQVTNKRVIFRAPGRCLAGRTTLQHEFAIDEIAGLEARREYVFTGWDLIIGLIVSFIGGVVMSGIISAISNMDSRNTAAAIILTLLLGTAGCVPFFIMKKKWLLKLLCIGSSYIPLSSVGSTLYMYGQWNNSGADTFFGGLFQFLGFIGFILMLFCLFLYAIKPNLVLLIKTKGAMEAIDIKRKKMYLFGNKEDHTGYTEVLPEDDAERCIREIDAMINDIQKLGDFGIEKWKK